MRAADVLLTGEYYCDLIFAGLPGVPRLGAELLARDLAVLPGGTYNIALALPGSGSTPTGPPISAPTCSAAWCSSRRRATA